MEEDNVKKKKWIDAAFVLFVIPIIAYIILYVYESGYASYFGIPNEFISIDINKLLYVIGGLLGLIFIILNTINLFVMLFSDVESFIIKVLKPLLPSFIMCIALFYLYGKKHWKEAIPYFLFLAAFTLFITIFPLITQTKVKTYKEKFKAQEENDSAVPSIGTILIKLFGRKTMLYLSYFLMFLSLVNSAGRAIGMNKTEFVSINTSQDVIILSRYSDNFICTRIDKKNRKIEKEFFLIGLNNAMDNPYKVLPLDDFTVNK